MLALIDVIHDAVSGGPAGSDHAATIRLRHGGAGGSSILFDDIAIPGLHGTLHRTRSRAFYGSAAVRS